ncbi:MAG TPA: hypothetical protein VGU45_00095 [Microvirga sp.]|jgi:hypothetical protein|nr:hypothetical protein [Microvirga sp.]
MKRVMLAVLPVLLPVLLATEAFAQARLQTPRLGCANVQQIVASQGAVVLGTGGFTYDRFVRHRGFCQRDEYTEPAYVPAADTPQCFAGYRCISGPPPFFDF